MTTKSKFGTASMIFGILALISFPLIIPPLIFGPLSIIFAIISRTKDHRFVKGALIGGITGFLGLLACIFITVVAFITTFRSIDFSDMLSAYTELLDYTSTLSDQELIDFLDDLEHGDYSGLSDFYNTPTPTDDQIWY